MDWQALERHPAFLALAPAEQLDVRRRLERVGLDDVAVAALSGGLAELDAADLRFWLAAARARPFALLALPGGAPSPVADTFFSRLVESAVAAGADPQHLVGPARALSRSFQSAETARLASGFLREDLLAALWAQIEEVGGLSAELGQRAVLGAAREAGWVALTDALTEQREAASGLSGFFAALAASVKTGLIDLADGARFLANGTPEHEGRYEAGVWQNWNRAYEGRPARFACPRTEAELVSLVANAVQVRAVGGGHTFNDSPLCDDLMISLDEYDAVLEIDASTRRARVQGGLRLRDLNRALWAQGLCLPVAGSTDAQSIAGLVATDLHGTGRDHGFLSEQLRSLRVVAADGTIRTTCRGEPLFHAVIGGLGTCGVVCEVELAVVERFHLEKSVAMAERAATEAGIEALLAENDHLSLYYVGGASDGESLRLNRWNRTAAPLSPDWEKLRAQAELKDYALSAFLPGAAELLANLAADSSASDALAPDETLVVPGSIGFGRRLFYAHDEIEYGVAFPVWRACVAEVLTLLSERDFFSIVEVRFAPDLSESLLGPGAGRRTAFIELATPLAQRNEAIYAEFERIMRRHGGQPHLGKKSSVHAQDMLEIHGTRFLAFQEQRQAQDPGGKFLNPFAARVLGA